MNILILGGTGLIGSAVIRNAPDNVNLYAIGRSKPQGIENDNFIQTDFKSDFHFPTGIDKLIIAFGTTIGKVKSKEKFHFVDVTIPQLILKKAKEKSVQQVFLVSSIGTTPNAKTFYLKCKWELEQYLVNLDYPSYFIYRPSMLKGNRQEYRWKEELGLKIMTPLEKLFPKLLKSFAAVSDEKLSNKIWNDLLKTRDFKGVIESKNI